MEYLHQGHKEMKIISSFKAALEKDSIFFILRNYLLRLLLLSCFGEQSTAFALLTIMIKFSFLFLECINCRI